VRLRGKISIGRQTDIDPDHVYSRLSLVRGENNSCGKVIILIYDAIAESDDIITPVELRNRS